MASLNVVVSGYGTVMEPHFPDVIVFYVHVQQGGCNNWIVYRRYEEFQRLSNQLNLLFGAIPTCPPRRFDRSFPDTIEKARAELSMWLMQLLQHPPIYQSHVFLEFIRNGANMVPNQLQHVYSPSQTRHNIGELDMDEMFHNEDPEEMHEEDMFGFDYNNETPELVPNRSFVPSPPAFPLPPPFNPQERKRNEKVSLDDFIMIKVIGKGSFGKVLLVKKKQGGMIYAMKVLQKENIIKRNQVEHTRTERHVLGYVRHPFIVGLNYAFQTDEKLYFVLDYCAGGELFFHLGKVQRFPESRARFYAAEITLAIEYVHNLDIIYRDLKPENVLLDANGHIRLTDFGLSKEGIQDDFSGAHSFCGTPEYLAPEILNRSGHGRAVDWWSLGALLYEMLTGLPPFYCRDRDKLFEKIRKGELTFPKYLSIAAKDLLTRLLERDPTKRLGTGPDDAGEIKNHIFFKEIQWDALARGQISPPWTPTFSGALDTSQFDREFTDMPLVSPENTRGIAMARRSIPSNNTSDLFKGFTYTEESYLQDGLPIHMYNHQQPSHHFQTTL